MQGIDRRRMLRDFLCGAATVAIALMADAGEATPEEAQMGPPGPSLDPRPGPNLGARPGPSLHPRPGPHPRPRAATSISVRRHRAGTKPPPP